MNTICKFALLGTAAADLVETQPHSGDRHALLRSAKQEVVSGENTDPYDYAAQAGDAGAIAAHEMDIKDNKEVALADLGKSYDRLVLQLLQEKEDKMNEIWDDHKRQMAAAKEKAAAQAEAAAQAANEEYERLADQFVAEHHRSKLDIDAWHSQALTDRTTFFENAENDVKNAATHGLTQLQFHADSVTNATAGLAKAKSAAKSTADELDQTKKQLAELDALVSQIPSLTAKSTSLTVKLSEHQQHVDDASTDVDDANTALNQFMSQHSLLTDDGAAGWDGTKLFSKMLAGAPDHQVHYLTGGSNYDKPDWDHQFE